MASNLSDAIELFKHNKDLISYIALDGDLSKDPCRELPETIELAKVIANSRSFTGKVFAMSSRPSHNYHLMETLGDRCEILRNLGPMMKVEVIQEIIRRVLAKRS